MARLGDICRKITDGSHNPPSGIEHSDYLMISSKNIDDDRITFDDPRYLSQQDYIAENKRTNISPGDLLMTIVGTIGRIAVVPQGVGNICLQRSVAVIKPDLEIIEPRYLMYHIQALRALLEKEAHGVAQKGLYLKQVEQIEISLPEMSTQLAICKTLDKLTDLIAMRKRQLEKLDELVKARFVEMFGDPIGNPMKWDIYQLDDCLERIDSGKSFVCSDKPRIGSHPAVLKLSAATYGDYRPFENKALLDESLFVEEAEVRSGDLLFTRKNTPELVGMATYVQETPPKLMMPDLIFRLVPNEKMNAVFLWQLINCKEFRPIIQGISGGSAKSMSNISKERLGKIKVICPPRKLQDKLTPFITQIDKSKVVIQKSLEATQTLFDSLMQQYF